MIEIKNPSDCCGCTACASICRHEAISMEPDDLGFLYPKVDKSKCVDCGLCDKVCAFNDNYNIEQNFNKPLAYGVRHKSFEEVMRSRSGAAFVAISDLILKLGGVVYGAGYSDHFRVVHKRAQNSRERDEFRGSKYVQSDMTGVFGQVKKDLQLGMHVLFSGTPCQNAGLKSFLPRRLQEKLYCIDIVCHAVPSPHIWKEYLELLEQRYKGKIISVDFRDKNQGWAHKHVEKYVLDNGKEIRRETFTGFFNSDLDVRYSCNKCHYANINRPSDITLADFWGFEKVVPEMNTDNKGLSLVLVNTSKGKKLFDGIADVVNSIQVPIEKCLQPNLCHPTKAKNEEREAFISDYKSHGIRYVACKYSDWSYFYPFKKFMCKVLKKIM